LNENNDNAMLHQINHNYMLDMCYHRVNIVFNILFFS